MNLSRLNQCCLRILLGGQPLAARVRFLQLVCVPRKRGPIWKKPKSRNMPRNLTLWETFWSSNHKCSPRTIVASFHRLLRVRSLSALVRGDRLQIPKTKQQYMWQSISVFASLIQCIFWFTFKHPLIRLIFIFCPCLIWRLTFLRPRTTIFSVYLPVLTLTLSHTRRAFYHNRLSSMQCSLAACLPILLPHPHRPRNFLKLLKIKEC